MTRPLAAATVATVLTAFVLAGCGQQSGATAPERRRTPARDKTPSASFREPGALPLAGEKARFKERVIASFKARDYDELEATVAAIRAEHSRDAEGKWWLDHFYDALEAQRTKGVYPSRMNGWRDAHPDSVAVAIVTARVLVRKSWKARGSGYADTISAGGLQEFRAIIGEARDTLLAIDFDDAADPEYFRILLKVGVADGFAKKELYRVFEAGVTLEPAYHPLYQTMAWGLQTKWHGDPGELLRFAASATDKLPEPQGSEVYARIALAFHGHADVGPFEWERMRGGIEHMATYPEPDLDRLTWAAVKRNDRELARALFARLPDTWHDDRASVWSNEEHYRSWRGWALRAAPVDSALHALIHDDDIEGFRKAIRDGAPIDAVDEKGRPPIVLAAELGRPTMVKTLVDGGAAIDAPNVAGLTALMEAARRDDPRMVKFLLDKGASQDATESAGMTALHLACAWGGAKAAAALMTRTNAPVNAATANGSTPAYYAAKANRPDIMAMLTIQSGIDLDIARDDGWNPLLLAAQQGNVKVVEVLLLAGADPTVRSKQGNTPLHFAIKTRHPGLVEMLVQTPEVDINARNAAGWTPLMQAADRERSENLKILIDHGADVSAAIANGGWQALHLAARRGDDESVRLLIDAGADVNAGSATPLSQARMNNHPRVAEILVDAGATP